jgi:hypothetical protein
VIDSNQDCEPEEMIRVNGVNVIDIEFSTDNPGVGAGMDSVILHDGRYWYGPDGGDLVGPYSSAMDAVIKNELNLIFPTTDTIEIRDSDAKEFEANLKARYDAPFNVVLNGKTITVSEEN